MRTRNIAKRLLGMPLRLRVSRLWRRPAASCVRTARSCDASREDGHMIRVIGASQDVSVERGYFALRLALKSGLAQDKISRSEILEAGGVEPPSEKPCNSKTTCLSRSDCFTGRAQSGQDALPASPMILPPHYGPKRDGQPTV